MTFSSPLSKALFVAAAAIALPAHAQETALGAPSAVPLPNEPITVGPSESLVRSEGFGESIAAAPIDAPSSGAAGLVGAGQIGLPTDMWRGTDGARAISLIDAAQPSNLWRANALLRRTMIAGAEPPENAEGLLARRAAALLRFGAPEEAASLAGAAGADADLGLRRVGTEADLIIGREDALCKSGVADPDTAPEDDPEGFWATLRGYCLARSGDPLAAVAIAAMQEIGKVDPDDAALLEAIVDKELAEYIPNPAAEKLTPLRIAMLRRLGRSVGLMADRAPLSMIAGLFALESTSPKGAVQAAERLEAAGSISTKTLVDLYIRHADALGNDALGQRAKAVRDALKSPDAGRIGNLLLSTAQTQGAETFTRLARALAPVAATLPPETAQGLGPAAYAIRDSLLLGGKIAAAGRWSDAQGPRAPADQADTNALFAVADATWPGGWQREWGDLLRQRASQGDENARRSLAALAGFEIGPGPRLPNEGFLKAAREGRTAEAIFGAMQEIGMNAPASARSLDTTIRALRAVNLDADARAIAIEVMLKARWM